ncbi:hypothetical protein OHB07_31920 [Streptomyces sp. NBC_00111]|uniref:hypothetical protein n=1 Tax=Streptomyces sp. NBC_00111 TaxID=2975655 RepID=UPI00324E349B
MDGGAARDAARGRGHGDERRAVTAVRRWWSRCAVLAAAAVGAALLTAPTALAAPAAAQAAPCPQLPCEGADPGQVTAWQSGGAPKVLKQTTLASGTTIIQYTGKPAWDASGGRTYTWAEVRFGTGVQNGRLWLRTEDNWGDGINIITPLQHPRSYRATTGTTGMFVYSTSIPQGTYANSACVTDGSERGCLNQYAAEVVPLGPCEGWCAEIADPVAVRQSDWSYVERSAYDRVELPSGASVQQVAGRLKQGSYLGWAEGELPSGGRFWLEAWQGQGRWGQVYSALPRDGASRTATGSTRAFSWLPELRACVSDATGTECTRDGDFMATTPPEAPCSTLPCTGIDPASVTEWMPNYEGDVVEDANIYLGGRFKIYQGRPAWDPYHMYYWGEAELPPGRDDVSATLMKHASSGADSRTARPVPLPGGRLTASGTTKMVALDPLSGDEIAGLVVDGKKWAFATQQGNNIDKTSVQGPVGLCAPGQTCEGISPGAVTTWSSKATEWAAATLPSGARVTLSGGRPDWSVTDHYAWAHSDTAGVTVWLEDKQSGGTYAKVADADKLKATDGRWVRACLSDGTTTKCTTPTS